MNEENKKEMTIRVGKKATALIMATLLSAGLLAGCAGSASSGTDEYAGKTIYGEVTKVSSNSFTIDVGTQKEMQKSATVSVDSDTKITKGKMGGHGGSGQPPQGEPPQGAPGQDSSSDSKDSSDSSNSSSNSDSDSNNSQNQPPQGQPPQGEPPQGAPGQDNSSDSSNSTSEELDVKDIEEGDTVKVTFDKDGDAETVEIMGGGPGAGANGQGPGSSDQGSANVEYTAVKTYKSDKTLTGKTITSTEKDENAVLVKKGGSVTLDDMTIVRKSSESSSGDNASFYGTSAAVLGTGGKTYVTNSTIKTNAEGGAGIFSYGDGTVYASDSTITTKKGSSGGIHVAGGGTLYAYDLNVKTSAGQSAAIRSDRGGGKMVVDGGTYTSTGNGSPAIYSTADIAVNDAKLTAKGSEAICIEGKNSVSLYDSTLTGNMKDDSQNDCTWNVILYQSMSGDSEEGTSKFTMDGGTIKAGNGGMFYTTNTSSKFVLKDVNIKYAEDNEYFLKATGNSNKRGWGKTGSNGADCDFTAIDQAMKGDVIWDKISKLDMYITDGSSLKGGVIQDNDNAGSGKGGYANIYIDKDSTWTVTKNSKVTNLYNAGTIKGSDGKKVTIKGTDGKVYQKGDSKFTITVDKYSANDKTDKADTVNSWNEYAKTEPSQLA